MEINSYGKNPDRQYFISFTLGGCGSGVACGQGTNEAACYCAGWGDGRGHGDGLGWGKGHGDGAFKGIIKHR